ncbi:hypothetical protein [Microcoleus sp. FACHB-68]|uniref:hypothetical protein n=1 Tax=Microcoleus sp. FACHB-68 TaxID=2692826 RepID=UPI0016866F1D|nr:hypothetical protein [Microcoleus sp. FACHB-68]MBD1939097.1 hypothetical protein [Microcoleus sp. FACHB-68]
MAEIVPKNVNRSHKILPGQEGLIELYKPKVINGVPLSGYLADFQVTAVIRSVAEMIPPIPDAMAGEQEIENEQYALAKSHPGKQLGIYVSTADDPTPDRKFGVLLWNRNPHFETSLIERFTGGINLLIAEGTTIYGKMENHNSGLLGAGDSISIWIAAYEEGSVSAVDIGNLRQVIYTLNLENANQEYNFTIPDGCQGYIFKCRGDEEAGDVLANIKYSWQPGKVTSADGYDFLPATSEESEPYLPPMFNKTLYFASYAANTVIVIKLMLP